jgi:hypothetical protein
MIEDLWVSLDKAAEFVDVSKPTILRRAVYFNKPVAEIEVCPCPEGKVRFKKLKLGKGTRQERRYYIPDLRLWLN